jgi:DNA-binding response OmpR family regulator
LTEDEPSLRALARHVLQINGYNVLEAGRGRKRSRSPRNTRVRFTYW